MYLEGNVIQRFNEISMTTCIHRCIKHLDCKSISFDGKQDKMYMRGTCELLSVDIYDISGVIREMLVSRKDSIHVHTPPEESINKVRNKYFEYFT